MKMFRNGFWQKLILILAILVELGILITFFYYFANGILKSAYALTFIVVLWLFSLGLGIFIINSKAEDSYKIAWIFFVAGIPLIGPAFYLLFAHKMRTKKQSRHLELYFSALRKEKTTPEVEKKLEAFSPDCAALAHYIEKASDGAIYENTSVEYFSLGDGALSAMADEMAKARHYIFIEYFIITPGKIWNRLLKILQEKAREGVDIRVVYDDFGNLGSTPIDYDEFLRKNGIQCHVFRKMTPALDIRMNNRDHRKILIIDGHTCFTGGVNLADEYANAQERYGHWKDNCILVKGNAVYGYTLLFLANWVSSFEPKAKIDYDYYASETFIAEVGGFPASDGFVQPYGDLPYADNSVGEGVYLQMLGRSKEYVYISTPYLVIDEKMRAAFKIAAMQGIDVRVLTPGTPDKKLVYELTRLNYGPLLKAGVRVYEYTPGFLHQKMFIADDKAATIGTINLDYRSLYLHMENGTFMAGTNSLALMKRDFLDTIGASREITYAEWKLWKKKKWLLWSLLSLAAPLL
jgi:cardiolipin synthase